VRPVCCADWWPVPTRILTGGGAIRSCRCCRNCAWSCRWRCAGQLGGSVSAQPLRHHCVVYSLRLGLPVAGSPSCFVVRICWACCAGNQLPLATCRSAAGHGACGRARVTIYRACDKARVHTPRPRPHHCTQGAGEDGRPRHSALCDRLCGRVRQYVLHVHVLNLHN
jgi:hypothetical protein